MLGHLLDDAVVLQAIADQVLDGADLEAVALGEGDQVRHARHGAVVVHDLADDAGRVEPGEAREIDGGLRVAGADQHAALARDQREDVAGRDDVVVVLGGVDGGGDGAGAVVRGDAGGDALARLDRDGEGRAVARLVLARHVLEPQLVGALLGERQADQAAAVLGHEVDGVGRRHLRGDDEVALVLAVLGVDQDDHAAVAQVLDDLVDRRQEALALRVLDSSSSRPSPPHTPSGPRHVAREQVDLEVDPVAGLFVPKVVWVKVWGMRLMPKRLPSTSLTVSEMPSSATEPLGAM